jgi:hypothetical protein
VSSGRRFHRAAAAAAGAFIALAVSLPAVAGLFDDDEARRRIENLRTELAQQGKDNEARIAKLEELIRNIGVVELVRSLEQAERRDRAPCEAASRSSPTRTSSCRSANATSTSTSTRA